MYSLKGFIAVDGLENSSSSVVSAIGEISTLSLTFARGVGEYTSQPLPYKLYSFSSKTASGPTNVPTDLLSQVFSIVDWAIKLQQSGTPAVSVTDFTTAMTSQFGTQVTSVGCGSFISNGSFSFPEFITWVNPTLVTNDPSTGGTIKLWFSDARFQSEYDEYSIVVVPPLPSIDTFMTGAASVATALASYSTAQFLNAIQTAKGGYPETEMVPQTFDYVDPTNPQNQITTTWSLLIYGAAGNNIDAIRAAIQAYILANSQYPTSNWQQIFPEIYTSTEFLILPRWNDYAIPNLVLTQGGYSAIVSLNKQLSYLKQILTDFDPNYINSHACVIPCNYKSLEMLVMPSTSNASAEQELSNIFPDLMNVPTTDTLFNQMSSKTRSWVTMIQEMVMQAENVTVQSTLPAGMSTAVRNNVLYVAQEYAGVTYLVATKSSTPAYS